MLPHNVTLSRPEASDQTQAHRSFSYLFSRFSQRHIHILFFLVAVDRDPYRVAGTMIVHHLRQSLLVLDLFAIDGNDQISAEHDRDISQIGAFGAAAEAR